MYWLPRYISIKSIFTEIFNILQMPSRFSTRMIEGKVKMWETSLKSEEMFIIFVLE